MQFNLEKIIPEIWWDFFGRLIPGLVVFFEIKFFVFPELGDRYLNVIKTFDATAIVVSSYIIGHFIQPFGSRTDEFFANYHRNRCCEKAKKAAEEKKKMGEEQKTAEEKYEFRDIMNIPKNFLESYIAAKKKHSEAVSFFSVLWPSILIWLYFCSGFKPSNVTATIALAVIIAYSLPWFVQSSSNKVPSDCLCGMGWWNPGLLIYLLFFTLAAIAVIVPFLERLSEYKPHPLWVISFIALVGGYERSKNYVHKQSKMTEIYNIPGNRAICDDAIAAVSENDKSNIVKHYKG